jgi:sugar lactone lactonase YvrE
MKQMQTTRLKRRLGTIGTVAAVAGLVLGLGAPSALAQNAVQTAALARLGRAQRNAHPQSSNVEATNTSLYLPSGLAFDAAGDLFIADTGNHLVLEVNLAGIISTVAGTGEQGFGGDGGAATIALLDSPTGVAVDAAGNLFIADTHNQRIREVSGGTIATIAGTGAKGFSGDGAAATAAALNLPTGVAVDSNGNVYIADTNNHRIREISASVITTVAGDGEQTYSGDGGLATAAGLDSPSGVAVDAAFNLYIGDTQNQCVRMVTFSTGIISTLIGNGVKGFNGDGVGVTAELAGPRGVAVGANGSVYVADSDNQRVRSLAAGQVTTIAGNGEEGYTGDTGVATSAELDTPSAVAVLGSLIALADSENQTVREVSGSAMNTTAGTRPGVESIVLNGLTTNVYGTGTLIATFSNGSNIATGQVTFYDGLGASSAVAGTVSLSANTAVLNTSLLAAGPHSLVASYAGDANNPAITSGVYVLEVTPVQLTAVANAVNLLYGQAIPALTGTLNGVLAQDTGKVTASFTTTATITSAPGTYPIAVALAGSSTGNYTVVLGSGSGSVVIAQAPSKTALAASSQTPIFGTSLTLTATVASTTSGTPSGTVSFYNGATLLNTTPANLTAGVATLALTTLPVGAQSITAVYSGSTNFLASTSSALTPAVLSPDFSITASPAAQTVLPTQSVNYTITLTPMNPIFVYPVSLSASPLPTGVTAVFAPSSIATGAAASTTVLTLTASAQARLENRPRPWGGIPASTALALLMLPLAFTRRMRKTSQKLARSGRVLIAMLALAAASALVSCGGGGFFSHATQTYTVTVTAVSGPDTHSTNVTLTVQ